MNQGPAIRDNRVLFGGDTDHIVEIGQAPIIGFVTRDASYNVETIGSNPI